MRWIIDAMNVIGSRPDGWWKDRHQAMVRLTRHLERWAAADGRDVTVVFERPPSPPIDSEVIAIGAAPRAGTNSADDEIIRMVHADRHPHHITVVTSDSALLERVREAGANTYPAKGFRDLIEAPPAPGQGRVQSGR
ncbi:NYN domain-containing protein [Mycolicibacter kumamotonensis]|uniref:RNA-binding protein n=1 Tax=Mycolicibacter kumamotonensis TaxID=354243 RepID=A0A1B8SJM1_9MYCO|nr:NYN domain-containing protein [Mycolicibacter kumamotonensis]OBY32919.1 RNA-binding protein [Mycolicibacter kumamotonensis]ORA77883.1 RNA-binding protein [Mycolicibacter kumamotonensis]